MVDFLGHLEQQEFAASPRPVGSGFDDNGNEVLSFIEGKSPHPLPWSDDAIIALGGLLADLHDAAKSYQPRPGAVWKDWFGRHIGEPTSGFGHGDLGPWNVMAIDGMPSGFIDWDTAGPMDPVYEVAQTVWLNVQLHDDDIAERIGLSSARQRAKHVAMFLDAYGLSSRKRVGFIDKMVEVAVRDSAHEAIEHDVTPDTTSGVAADGYPFAWGIAWRVRSAAWMLRNRKVLEAALNSGVL